MDDVLRFLQRPTGYRFGCDLFARRQRLVDQLLRDAVKSEATPDAEQDQPRDKE
jgi:hypothetical protein